MDAKEFTNAAIMKHLSLKKECIKSSSHCKIQLVCCENVSEPENDSFLEKNYKKTQNCVFVYNVA